MASSGIDFKRLLKALFGGVVALLVLFLVIKFGLDIITRHNRTVAVPDFTNMTIKEAEKAASEGHVGVKVTDSVFIYRLGSGLVFRQNPTAGSIVKRGRSIFLTINSVEPKTVIMPNLVGCSFLEAKAEIENRGLVLGRLIYQQDIATNQVLQQRSGGKTVNPGKEIISGSTIDLVLGLGRSDSTTRVPDVVGMKYVAAVDALHDKYLNSGKLVFDNPSQVRTYADTMNAVVYRQDPGKSTKKLGTQVTLYLTHDPEKLPEK